MTARVSMLLKSRASPDIRPFTPCNKKSLAIRHMNRPLFPTTLSIPSYDTGKKVGLRTYQHTNVHYEYYMLPLHFRNQLKTFFPIVGCPQVFRLKDPFHQKFLESTFTVNFMTDGFEPPVTEGRQSFCLTNKCTKNFRLQEFHFARM